MISKGLVNKIIPFSYVDGPGNRTSIFFQGCNFDCMYCHNPETINICNNCKLCIEVCPYNALEFIDGNVKWNDKKCKECGLCIEKCIQNCGPKSKYMSVSDIIEELLKFKSFISGITVSGGECTLQKEFLEELFIKVKKLGLTIFVDSNGSLDFSKNLKFLDLIDSVMLDVKSFDPDEHKMLTSASNDMVIKNMIYLASKNKLYEVRTVIVPDLLNNEKNVYEISKMLASINSNIKYKIIKFRPIGVREDKVKSYTPTDDYMNYLKSIALENGCKEVIIL